MTYHPQGSKEIVCLLSGGLALILLFSHIPHPLYSDGLS